jgi:hypothetical protein
MSGRLKRVAARGAKRLLSILIVVSLLVGSAGVPTVTRVAKDRSQPFPCQDNPCGCASADECWHHCCCHTNREKVAWAQEHGVTPPDFVVAAAEKEEHSAERTCCTHHHCEKCAAKAAAQHDDVCAAPQDSTDQKVAQENSGKSSLKFRLVLVDFARHCRSLPQFWSLIPAALPVRIETAWSFDETVIGRVVDAPVLERCVELSPPTPPPKLDSIG